MKLFGDFDKLRKLRGLLDAKRLIVASTRAIAEEVILLVNEGFAGGHDPYGKPWPQPEIRTGAEISPLSASGRLRRSFNASRMKGDLTTIVVRTANKYAVTHQYGLTIVPRPENSKGLLFFRGYATVKSKKTQKVRRKYGDWIAARKVKIPVRLMLPTKALGLPSAWATRMQKAAQIAIDNFISGKMADKPAEE